MSATSSPSLPPMPALGEPSSLDLAAAALPSSMMHDAIPSSISMMMAEMPTSMMSSGLMPIEHTSTSTDINDSAAEPNDNHTKSSKKSTAAGKEKGEKRWTWSKPEGKPKRPLSSYNLFFRNCREKLVAGLPIQAALATGNAQSDEQLSQDLAEILTELANTRAAEARMVASGLPPPKRAHKRLHGKVSFKDMAKTVGDAWKTLDNTTRTIYDAAAAVEKKRYVAEVQRWREEQERKKPASSIVKAKKIEAATTKNTSTSTSTTMSEPKKKKAKKSSTTSTTKKIDVQVPPTATVPPTVSTGLTANAKATAKRNAIRNAERRRLAALKTIADQRSETTKARPTTVQQQQPPVITGMAAPFDAVAAPDLLKKKDPYAQFTSVGMPSALSMMTLSSSSSTPLCMSPDPTSTSIVVGSARTTTTTATAVPSSMASYLPTDLLQQLQQKMVQQHNNRPQLLQQQQIQQQRQPQTPYTPAELPSTTTTARTFATSSSSSILVAPTPFNSESSSRSTSGSTAFGSADFASATLGRLLEKTSTFGSGSAKTSTTNPLAFLAESTKATAAAATSTTEAATTQDAMDIEPLPEAIVQQHQQQAAPTTTAATGTAMRRSSSLLSLSDVPLDFTDDDLNELSAIFDADDCATGTTTAASNGPAVAATAAAAFGAKPQSHQASFVQQTALAADGHNGDDLSGMLNNWGGARSA